MAGSFGKRSGGNEKLRERSGGKLRKIWRDGSIHTGGIESSASHGPLAIRYQPTSFTSTDNGHSDVEHKLSLPVRSTVD